jgi:hypothetical protein
MAGGKNAPGGKNLTSLNCTAIDLYMKIRMIHKY